MSRGIALALLMATMSVTESHAQPTDNTATAEQLFKEARILMAEDRFTEACPKLIASYKLDEATGTLLNLAVCYENTGKLASAWGHYREAIGQDLLRGEKKRAAVAKARADALEPRLARLTIAVPEASQVSGLVVKRDGQPVDAALFGVATYVDAGDYQIVASAQGHRSNTHTVTAVDGREVTVEIPTLEPEPKPPIAPQEPPEPPEPSNESTEGRRPGHARRILGVTTGVAGLAMVATSVGLGLSARSSWNDAFDNGLCDRPTLTCDIAGKKQTDAARTLGNTGTVVAAIGAAATAAGVVLYLTAPRRGTGRHALGLAPLLRADGLGLTISRRF